MSKKFLLNLLLSNLFIFNFLFCNDEEFFQIGISSQNYNKMNFLICCIGQTDKFLENFIEIVKKNFEFSKQFAVTVQKLDNLKTKKELMQLESQGYPLALFISKSNGIIEWRLYDTAQAEMIRGKKIHFNNVTAKSLANNFSDDIWPVLTAQDGYFSSLIAACKREPKKRNSYLSSIYVLSFTEIQNYQTHKPLIVESSIIISPRWHNQKPLLYYSKHTKYNVRLLSTDLDKKKSIVVDFDGLNMDPTFSNDGKVALLLTKNGKSRLCKYEFDSKNKKGAFVPLTKSSLHAVSPSFIDDNRVLFCAIDELNKSRIAILDINKDHIEYVSDVGSTSPSFNKKKNAFAYCKKVNGISQIFLYDLDSKKNNQLTFTNGDKDGCSWSPCCNYLIFSVESKNESRIAVINIITNEQNYLTPKNEYWCYPTWSPNYKDI